MENDIPQVNPIEDQRKEALRHYEEAARITNHWSSFVRNAILAYNPQPSEQKPPVDKTVTAPEDVSKGAGENVPHDAINLLNLNFGNSKVAYWTIKDRIAVLMQEFAQQSMKQERERAIQECIDVADKFYNDSNFGIGKNLHEILVENLKK